MEEIRMTSSSKDGHRQVHHNNPTYDVESSRESGSSSHREDEDDGNNDNGKNDENQDKFSGPPLAFTEEEGFTHMLLKMKIMARDQVGN